MALKKSMINKLEKHIGNYFVLWITASFLSNILKYMPELRNCKVYNPMMPAANLYLYYAMNKNDIANINKMDDDLCIYQVTGKDLNYDEIKYVISKGIQLHKLKHGNILSTYNMHTNKQIDFKYVEINDL